MNKKIIVITILSIITGLVIFNTGHNKTNVEEDIKLKSTNMLTMMLETEAGTGNYEEVAQSEWPQDGYVFNASLSRCENGGTLSWDDDAKKVVMKSNVSDKCYVYFDLEPLTFADYMINNVYTADGENGLYYHDGVGTYTNADQEAGDNSYRYSGADPNNYMCFGSDVTTCPNENLYRIIGLFDDDQDGTYNIKLIKNLSIGNYFWDHDDISFSSINNISNHSNEYTINQMNNILAVPDPVFGANDWQTADINYYINNDLFWDSLDSNWQNIIMSTNWIAGGNSEENIMESPIKLAYQNEIINPTENVIYSDEIGLMYVSDYGYAASPENWQTNLSDYDNDINCNNNWLFVGLKEWTITPNPSASNNVFFVFSDGNLLDDYFNAGKSSVRPVFYLKSEVRISGGTGTSSDPYRLA